ncbi:hypothetical protein MPSEU_000016700 [Mayamaea pseudoterrestris]|nr:hypothetical protein MPSEU_000016700 [Mayamaea pseudoterrestris]
MIPAFARLFFLLSVAMGGAAGCSDSGARRLGSPLNEQDAHDRTLQDAFEDSQSHCGFQSPSVEERLQVAKMVDTWKASGRKLQSTVMKNYTIPVYIWHAYAPGSTAGQILTKETIESVHFKALEYGFRQTPFDFDLKGIQIVESADYGKCERLGASEYLMKQTLKVAGKNVLNIYICDSSTSDSRSWSSYPLQSGDVYDGVVIRNTALVPALDKKETAIQNIVHETGHFLGLLHTFEGGCSPKVWNLKLGEDDTPVIMHLSGDDVADTPAHSGPTNALPGANVCWKFNPPLDTCKDLNNGADIGLDPINNHMNYVGGNCLKENGEFTPGQIERMIVQFETFRLDHICRPSSVTCTSSNQCCVGLTCKGGNAMKMKCM